jgi:signal transduction histidine kinase/CheY-like chemotaxis protein
VTDTAERSLRVLVLAPTSKDAELSQQVLTRAGMACACCKDIDEVLRELDRGAGALVVPEESIAQGRKKLIARWLERQPPWSDLPVLVLARPGADSAVVAQAMDLLGNVTVVERPTRVAELVSALRSALRGRSRQYDLRAHLGERERYLEALRENDRRKDEFLATLAHELRNPLAPIKSSVQMLRLRSPGDADSQKLALMMERQVNHMVRLVDDLLEMSRVTRGRIELRLEQVELADVIRTAIETSQPLIDAARHHITVTVPGEPLPVNGDATRLAQIFSNLLNNAAKYTDEGGRIWITAHREGMAAVVTVRDTGSGIPPEMLSRVFDMFTQLAANPTARRAHGGLGIGLTLVKSLVEMHGGTVEARSAGRGRGSEFSVRLPLVATEVLGITPHPQHQPAASAPDNDSLFTLTPRRVLVVDDNRDAAESLGMLLGLLRQTTRVVNSGADALDVMGSFKPAIAFLDIGMPGMDGHELARRIRAQPEWQTLTLVAMTGWGQDDDRRRSQSAGFDYHLVKPVDVRALESLLRSLDPGGARAAAG